MLPREAPLRNLAEALAKLDAHAPDRARIRQIRRTLNLGRDAGAALAELLRHGDDDHVCILVDQFEELFSFARKHGRDEAQLFVDILVGLQEKPPAGLYAILTMRSEFLGVCARFHGLAEAVNATQYLLPQMDRPALVRAIREPATLYEGEISRELAERLIADAGGRQDQLPLIQHGLMRLWRREGGPLPVRDFGLAEDGAPFRHDNMLADAHVPFRHEAESDEPFARPVYHQVDDAPSAAFSYDRGPVRRLGLEDYPALGLAELLSAHADEVMAEAAPDAKRQKIVEHLFRALTDINADGQAVRRPQTYAELLAVTGSKGPTLKAIIDHLRADGVSFLTPYGDRPIVRDTLIDISHEALVRCWQKIADIKDGWLQREFDDGLTWKSLRMQARKHETLSPAATDDRDAWLHTLPSEDWCKRYQGDWSLVQDLMKASRKARDEQVTLEVSEARRREAEERAHRAEAERQAAHALAAKQQELGAAQERIAEERARRAEEAHRAATAMAAKQQELREAQERVAEQQRRRADDAIASQKRQRRWTMASLATAIIAIVAAAVAWTESQRAHQAVIEAKAASFWSGLQLWSDPLTPREVATLWALTQQTDTVRVAFVRQLANNPALIAQFGFKPKPIARAVGLRWPDEALKIVKQSVAELASGQFDPKKANPWELVSYTRVLAALNNLLEVDPAKLASATHQIADAINHLAATPNLTGQQLWALGEMVGVFAQDFDAESVERATSKLREIIGSAERGSATGWALARTIEVMVPVLKPEERLRAVQYMIPLLGQNTDSWGAKAAPRALTALLPKLDPGQAEDVAPALPLAIVASAAASNNDSSYLLTLMQVLEEVAIIGEQAEVTAFGKALTRQFAAINEPLQRAALARAAIPLLPLLPGGPTPIKRQIADITSLVPDSAALDPEQRLDPVQRSLLRERALREAADELVEAVSSPDQEQRQRQSEALLDRLRADWNAEPSPDTGFTLFRRAAQGRLLAMLAPFLTPDSAALATADLLAMLPGMQDYLTREAIARALAALADKLTDTGRAEALAAAKSGLAMTGSTEEATAWAHAIAALLPGDPRAATAEIVEALKYPTATGAATDILLAAALATPWPEDYRTIAGRTLPDQTVLDWLAARLPEGRHLTDPPAPPPGMQSAAGAWSG
jgi:hypothetical protein